MRKIRRFLQFITIWLAALGLLLPLAGGASGQPETAGSAQAGGTSLYLPAIMGPTVATPLPPVTPASGTWLGTDKKKPATISIQFDVSDDHTQVNTFKMKFTVEGCTGSYEIIVTKGAPIVNGRFILDGLNQTFRAEGVFDTNETVSGSVQLYHYEIPGCATMTDSAQWTGVHRGPRAPTP